MGTGWRRAFCTTISRDREVTKLLEDEAEREEKTQQQKETSRPSPAPRGCSKFGFLSSSNPSTPRLKSNNSPKLSCKTNANVQPTSTDGTPNTPKLHCKTSSTTKTSSKSPRNILRSNPSSPGSPFSILKNSLRLSRSSCGVCMQSVKTGQGMAIYTAECSHTFHFPCIVEFLRKQNTLICPICKSPWKDVPLLDIRKLHHHQKQEEKTILMDAEAPPKLHEKGQENPPNVKHLVRKTYNDDEPLISPKFIPIPEENEANGEDEVGEFQGFFMNLTPSDDAFAHADKEFRSVKASLLSESSVVAVGRTHETVALVLKLKAPPPPPSGAHNSNLARRAPIDLVTVLDVGSSMSGAKLQMLKRAMRSVISSLGSADRLSIVSFSAFPRRIMPLRRMNPQGKRTASRLIDRLACSHGSCVSEALRKATKILEDRRERNPVASIVLLSDGQEEDVRAENDNQRHRSTHVSTTRFSHIEIPVRSYGLDQKAGGTNDPTEDAFSKCVGGLLSVVVRDLHVHLSFAFGSDPAEVVAVYSCNGRPTSLGSDFIRVGDLYAEQEKEFLIEMRAPTPTLGSHHVLSVRCSYKDAATQELYNREAAVIVPKPQAVGSALPRNLWLRNLFVSTRAIAESRRMMEHNELNKAMQLLSSARAFVMLSKCGSAEENVNSIEVALTEVQWRMQYQQQMMDQQKIARWKMNEQGVSLFMDENGEPLTPTSAWKAAEQLAKVAIMRKSLNRVNDLHGLENARF